MTDMRRRKIMAENFEKPVDGRGCKFIDAKVVQGIKHENCLNPKMIEKNPSNDGKPLHCMGSRCGCAEYE
jgi:hypothetical protein